MPNSSTLSRIRRNHGLEHATIHMLSRVHPHTRMAGHSDPGGFWLLGNLDTQDVQRAVDEALARLRAGESGLAIHPGCGTNLVTSGIASGLAAALALGSARNDRERLERLPLAILFATGALLLSRPLGTRLQQRVTTSGVPGDLRVVEIRRGQRGKFITHRITTAG